MAIKNWERKKNLETERLEYIWEHRIHGRQIAIIKDTDFIKNKKDYVVMTKQADSPDAFKINVIFPEEFADQRYEGELINEKTISYSNKERARDNVTDVLRDNPHLLTNSERKEVIDDIMEWTAETEYSQNREDLKAMTDKGLVDEWFGSVGEWIASRDDMNRRYENSTKDSMDDFIETEFKALVQGKETEYGFT